MCHREIEHTQVVFVPEVKCTRKLEQASSGTFFGGQTMGSKKFWHSENEIGMSEWDFGCNSFILNHIYKILKKCFLGLSSNSE